MTDTRSPEQRRTDTLSLAAALRARHEDNMRAWGTEQRKAYRAGRAAGLAGWPQVRGIAGMAHHEHGCDACVRLGTIDQWRLGFSDGATVRALEG